MQVLLFATLAGYALATFFRVKEKVAGRSFRHHSNFSLMLGLSCNTLLAIQAFSHSDLHLQYQALFVAGALSLGICTAITEHGLKETYFSIFSLPASIVLLFCSTFTDGVLAGDHFNQRWFAIHLLLSILGECFFFIAAVSSVTYFYVVRRLKRKNRLRAVFFFPPLTRLDDLTFKLIVSGTAIFTAGLATGLYGNYSHFANFAPGTKHIFALALLAFYFFIIVARSPLKLTGTRLAGLAIIGFFLSAGLVTLPDNSEHWKPLLQAGEESKK